MAKFNAFDEHCDASAVLTLLGKVPVFSHAVQSAAGDVRKARNAWAHCVFSDWDPLNFQQRFAEMEQLVKALGLPSADESNLLQELNDWEMKGAILCMNATIDPNLVKTVQQDVDALKNDVDKLTFEEEENRENLRKALQDAVTDLEELQNRVSVVEHEQEVFKQDQRSLCETIKTTQGQIRGLKSEQEDLQQGFHHLGEHLDTRLATVEEEQDVIKQEQQVIKQDHNELCDKVNTTQGQISVLQSDQEDVQQRVCYLEDQQNRNKSQINYEIGNCEADIAFFAERHDVDTRKWLLEDFDKWFSDPSDSRAYVLLGDPGIGKSVMAGVLAQRLKKDGDLGAAYFCRHNDGTRNDPRYLLGTVACQLCECNSEYNSIVGGEGGVRKLLSNSNLGIQELFTKLLQEPLGMSTVCQQRKLVIIDALDETQYESRDDFLDLIMNRFPLLPKWLVFFITSRPEETVQSRLNKYNPCIKICAGNSEDLYLYQQHERDIKVFLEKSVDFSHLPYSAEDITKKCNGLFLYAFYIERVLKDPVHSGKIGQFDDLFPGDIDNFFRQNFKRVFDKVGANLYGKLFGCAVVAPSPLPVSFISFILQRENSDLDEQKVIDAVSLFVVLQTSDQKFAFLHNLIPTWLTDKKKASRKLFIDKIKAGKYFRDVIVEILSAAVVKQQSEKPPSIEANLFNYCSRVGVRFLCGYPEKDPPKIVFSCFTSYQFIWKRIQNNGIEIYSVVADLKLATGCQRLSKAEKEILQEICLALESNVHVLQECPHLLHSCLRNASKAVQVNVVIPDGVSTTWMEWKVHPNPASEIFRDVRCFALSPDKKLLAGGKEQDITLFDACSFGKIQGPFKVIETEDEINYLEFSPDGKYVFFGRLDWWFSVEERCVRTFSQFSGKETRYKWGCFASSGRYIVVKGEHPLKQSHSLSCLVNIFCRWATQELLRVPSSEITLSNFPLGHLSNNHSRHFGYSGYTIESLRDLLSVLKTKNMPDWCCFLESHLSCQQAIVDDSGDGGGRQPLVTKLLCPDCDTFYRYHRKTTLTVARQRVVDLYPEIFEYQVWNVRTGRSALEEAFSSDVELSPFIYLCHRMTAFEDFNGKLFGDITKDYLLCNFAFMTVVYFLLTNIYQWSSSAFVSDSVLCSSSFVTKVPKEFHNRPSKMQLRLSLDDKWIAIRERRQSLSSDDTPEVSSSVKLFERKRFGGNAVHVVKDVQQFAFTGDTSTLLYVTKDKSLHALHLQTGNNMFLSSVTGFRPLFNIPEKQLGYIFCVQDEDKISFAKTFCSSLPSVILFQPGKSSVKSRFIPASIILSSLSDAVLPSLEVTQEFPVKKCVSSQDGNLIVTHQGTKILLFDLDKFVWSICDDRYDEDDVSCLTFSPDNTLLLYFIQKRRGLRTHDHDFYVWDVQNRVLSASFDSPSELLSIDCCCFSSDNTKLIICGEFSFEVWQYASGPRCLLAKEETNVLGLYTVVDMFSHCTVSPESDLLACCIMDRILLYELSNPTDRTILQLPRAHLGKIKFCQFLKGNRYLISYGVDGTVFLWDLSEWKAIAYAKIGQGRESIVSMAVSPEKDRVVCVTSFGRLHEINLCGLKCAKLSKLPLPKMVSHSTMNKGFCGQKGEPMATVQSPGCPANTDVPEDLDVREFLKDMNFWADDSEGSDEAD
ncbi:uncharacterized protein LOC144649228 [Oculina patagonica]